MTISGLPDRFDSWLCRFGLSRPASWDLVNSGRETRLYAGALHRWLPQFPTHIGISHLERSSKNIRHDLRKRMPARDSTVSIFQAEDVLEHIDYSELNVIVEDVFRILKPGGLFRLSVPDYRCDLLLDRCLKNAAGEPLFDPDGGGRFVDGVVVEGGHLWFPVYETVKALMDASSFAKKGGIRFLHYTQYGGESVLHDIDYSQGFILRTPDNDPRASSPRRAISIVVDAVKSDAQHHL